ncbi:hypothetical protein AHF37_01697 [Paragonimus kellicotti]|nr:hypothetical protein AHF37_01697 [Paragonimus kellicotti]
MRGIDFIEFKIQQRPILLIAKEGCPNCKAIEGILSGYHLNSKRSDNYEVLYIESRNDCGVIETYLWHKMIYRTRQCAIKMRGIDFIEFKIQQRPILLIAKEGCPNCKAIEGILSGYHLNSKRSDNYEVLYIESRNDCGVIETYLWHKMIYRTRQAPHLFVNGVYAGGFDEIKRMHEKQQLNELLQSAELLIEEK